MDSKKGERIEKRRDDRGALISDASSVQAEYGNSAVHPWQFGALCSHHKDHLDGLFSGED